MGGTDAVWDARSDRAGDASPGAWSFATAPAATLDGLKLWSSPGALGGFAAPGQARAAANGTLVRSIAARAQAWAHRNALAGTARQIGTAKHAYAMALLRRYQSLFGSRGLVAEVSYLEGERVEYGTSGSARLDVMDVRTREVWDYKFGARGLSPGQRLKILIQGPAGALVREVRP